MQSIRGSEISKESKFSTFLLSTAGTKLREHQTLGPILTAANPDAQQEMVESFSMILLDRKKCISKNGICYYYNANNKAFESPASLQLICLIGNPSLVETEKVTQATSLLNNRKIKNKLNASSVNDHTPLTYAASMGLTHLVELFIEHGADPNKRNNEGNTPLMVAAFYNQLSTVETLLKHKAETHVQDTTKGLTAFDVARLVKNPKIVALLKKAQQPSECKAQRSPQIKSRNKNKKNPHSPNQQELTNRAALKEAKERKEQEKNNREQNTGIDNHLTILCSIEQGFTQEATTEHINAYLATLNSIKQSFDAQQQKKNAFLNRVKKVRERHKALVKLEQAQANTIAKKIIKLYESKIDHSRAMAEIELMEQASKQLPCSS